MKCVQRLVLVSALVLPTLPAHGEQPTSTEYDDMQIVRLVHKGDVAYDAGRFKDARRVYRAAFDLVNRTPGINKAYDPILGRLVSVERAMHGTPAAEKEWTEELQKAESAPPSTRDESASAVPLRMLSWLAGERGAFDEAFSFLQRLDALGRKVKGEPIANADFLFQMAFLQMARGDTTNGLASCGAATDNLSRDYYYERNAVSFEAACDAWTAAASGNPNAKMLWTGALKAAETLFGKSHPYVGVVLDGYATSLEASPDAASKKLAATMRRRAKRIRESVKTANP
jgi:hypothetical protein